MSRLTAAQVIGLGEYLNPDFNPASLTVSQLLGVLGFHNIIFPTPYTKGKLIQLFNDEIKPNTTKFKRERVKREQSIASDDGITDGITGKPISEKIPFKRRSSRRLSRDPTKDIETSPVRPDPPKRRRSSAQPNLGGPSRKIISTEPTLIEESEPEEEELPTRKVVRSKKSSEAAGSQARRVSQGLEEESGWEDNNIFQSGAESSSPLRPPPKAKTTRKSVTARKSRKSMSAPPQMSSPPKPIYVDDDLQRTPPQSKFEPELPPHVSRETRNVISKAAKAPFAAAERRQISRLQVKGYESPDELNIIDAAEPSWRVEDEVKEDETGEESEDETITIPSPQLPESKPTPLILRLLYLLIVLATSTAITNFKIESAPIGYCDTGKNTNDALEALKTKWNAIEECNRENRTYLYPSKPSWLGKGDVDAALCPPPPLIPLLHPMSCTPCPEHASCSQHSITCATGYLLRPPPLLFFLPAPPSSVSNASLVPLRFSSHSELVWKVLSEITDGLPGLGSVGLPPQCVEDPQRKRNIGALGKAIESILGQERGRRLCAGDSVIVPEAKGGEAKRWGIEVESLRGQLKKKVSDRMLHTFDDTFNEAIQQLIHWGGVIIGEDSEGKRYVGHKTAHLTWDCVITVRSREIWGKWRGTVLGVSMVILTMFAVRARRAKNLVESKRVAELVQIALDTLRNQELAHHTDPITAPQPYLSSIQLRDLIMQDEHSVSSRRRVWDKVERVVEGNTNVRVNLEDLDEGDEMRVWRWVGSAGRGRVIREAK